MLFWAKYALVWDSHHLCSQLPSTAFTQINSQSLRCLVNSAQNQLGPILTWPKTNSAQLNNQLGPRYVPTRPKHGSCLFLYYFHPFLALSVFLFDFFFLSWIRLSNGIEIQDTWVRVGLCLAVHTVRNRPTNCTNNNSQPFLLVFKLLVLWSTQRLSTFMSTQRISRHVDIIFNISTKEQWKNKMSIITWEAEMSYATTFY